MRGAHDRSLQIGTFSMDGTVYGRCIGPCDITLCGIRVGDVVPDIEEAVSSYGEWLSTDSFTMNDGTEHVTVYIVINYDTIMCLEYARSGFIPVFLRIAEAIFSPSSQLILTSSKSIAAIVPPNSTIMETPIDGPTGDALRYLIAALSISSISSETAPVPPKM